MANYLKTGRQEMKMSDATYGLSRGGMDKYIDSLKLDIDAVKKAVKNVSAIQKAVDAGWQGYARDTFYEDLNESIENLLDSVEKEYKDLKYRLEELEDNLINQDIKMYGTN